MKVSTFCNLSSLSWATHIYTSGRHYHIFSSLCFFGVSSHLTLVLLFFLDRWDLRCMIPGVCQVLWNAYSAGDMPGSSIYCDTWLSTNWNLSREQIQKFTPQTSTVLYFTKLCKLVRPWESVSVSNLSRKHCCVEPDWLRYIFPVMQHHMACMLPGCTHVQHALWQQSLTKELHQMQASVLAV